MHVRRAVESDLDAVSEIYEEIHQAEEDGVITTGWLRSIYPIRATAEAALSRDDLFVLEENGMVLGSGIINQIQVDVYENAPWEHRVPEEQVCVLHTLTISPKASGRGLGKQFVKFYEHYAAEHGCTELRIDTNARNTTARNLYRKLGYKEIGICPTVFNGIPDVQLVLLEKEVEDGAGEGVRREKENATLDSAYTLNIIVTGFEPFGGEKINTSWEAVKELKGVQTVLLPVSFKRATAMIREIAASHPEAIICVGEAGGRDKISVERVAVNLMDARIPDNDGFQPVDIPIVSTGPAAYFSTLPTRELVRNMENTELSYTAGTYVCNAVFYTLMDTVRDRIPAGFIHVPKTMETQTITEALQTAVQVIAGGTK